MSKHTILPNETQQFFAPAENPFIPVFSVSDATETSILAYAMLPDTDPSVIDSICELTEAHFDHPACRSVFRVIRGLWENDEATHLENVGAQAKLTGFDGAVAEAVAIFDEPAAINPTKAIAVLRNRRTKRQLDPTLETLLAGARNGMPAAEILRNMAAQVEALDTGEDFPPLTPAGIWRETIPRPPEREYVFRIDGGGDMPVGHVGIVSGEGGTGKSKVFMQLMAAVAGGPEFAPFRVDKPMQVLVLNAEDDQHEMDRRFIEIHGVNPPAGLFYRSLLGKAGPLLEKRDGNPVRSKWFRWLDRTLSNFPDLGLLVIDPFSRFYGLDENVNEHNTAFVHALYALAQKHGIGILFINHVAKSAKGAELSSNSSRGGKALTDNSRWCAAMGAMRPEDAERFGMDAGNHVELRVVETNYSAKPTESLYFRRDEETGRYVHVSPERDRIADMARSLAEGIAESGDAYTLRELERGPSAKAIMDAIPGLVRGRDARAVVNRAVADGLLVEETRPSGKTTKKVFFSPGGAVMGINAGKSERWQTVTEKPLPALFPNESSMITVANDNADNPKFASEKRNNSSMITLANGDTLKGVADPLSAFPHPAVSAEDPEPEPVPKPKTEPEPKPKTEAVVESDAPKPKPKPVRLSNGGKARCLHCIHQQTGKNFCGFSGSIMMDHLACEFFVERPRR